MPHQVDYRFVWILALIVAPVILISIELFHPAGFTNTPGMFEYLREARGHTDAHRALSYFGPDWWFWLHMIQTPLVCLVSVGLLLTITAASNRSGRSLSVAISAWAAKLSLFVFVIYYTVLDAIGGIGLGRTLEIVNYLRSNTEYDKMGSTTQCLDERGASTVCLNERQVEGVALVLNQTWTDPWVGGVGSMISLTGSWAILLLTVLTALTIVLARGHTNIGALRWLSLALLVSGGWFVQKSHACCTGPLGFGLIFLFGCLTWWLSAREMQT